MHAQLSCGARARCLIFGKSHHLHPYFICVRSEGSAKTVCLYRLLEPILVFSVQNNSIMSNVLIVNNCT